MTSRQIKDTALGALKRAARAILKDELKALRAETKRQKAFVANNRATVTNLQRELAQARSDVTSYSNQLGQLRDGLRKAKAWASKHMQGNRPVDCLLQSIDFVPRYGEVHPFDRWDISPKP